MKTVLIGASGHSGMYLPDHFSEDRKFTAVAPGSGGESVDSAVKKLQQAGYAPAEYADYREMLQKEKPDVVIVDNFYGEHGSVILDAFAAGCHVLAEKPAAGNIDELERVMEAWKMAGTCFASMFTYRYDGAFYRARQLISQNAVGQIRLVNAQKSYKFGVRPEFMTRRESYGGTIPWVGIHGIDWILWMSGKRVKSVSAVQCAAEAQNGISPETTALAQFRMEDEVLASLTVDYLNPASAKSHGDDRVRIVGTGGVLEVRDGRVILTNGDGVQYPENAPVMKDMFGDFLKQVSGQGQCRISAEESFAANYAALLAQQAADSGEILTVCKRK